MREPTLRDIAMTNRTTDASRPNTVKALDLDDLERLMLLEVIWFALCAGYPSKPDDRKLLRELRERIRRGLGEVS